LRELAQQRGIELGTAVRGDAQKRNRAYRQVAAAQFSTVTPENEMKWYAVEPEQGEYAFDGADAIVEQAREAKQKVRGHTLVWHAQLPPWVKALGPSGLRQAMREHIRRVMAQYKGDVGVWDVVNEPIGDDGGLRNSVFMRRLGAGFIADAFRTARAADADARLYLNEIGAEGINAKSNRLRAYPVGYVRMLS
jgi:endo-1,4-beta-xylanase